MFAAIHDLYDRGRYLDAHDAAVAAGWDAWTGADLVLAARIRGRLGDAQGSRRLAARAWRQDPAHPAVAAWRLWQMLEVLGPAACAQRIPDWEGRIEHHRGRGESTSWHGAVCVAWSRLRDWERAQAAVDLGLAADPDDPWIATCAARLAADRDRMDEAIERAGSILARHPCHRPAILELGVWLSGRGRVDEATALLRRAVDTMQSGEIALVLAVILDNQGRSGEALAVIEDYPRLMPLLDSRHREGWLRVRSDIRYRCGDLAGSIADAEAGGGPFHAAVAASMRASGRDDRRVELPVPVVRQDHNTCAPATLASISRFFGIDQDQRAVADLICYDGTPDHRERRWAVDAGFHPVEFTVTWDAVCRLIDRGLPFTLTTRWATGAHLQAVIGHDQRRRTILIRDPGTPITREALAGPLLADRAAWGPRGMVLLPPGRHDEAPGLSLPDAEGWTRLHRLRVALDRNDIQAAVAALDDLIRWSPDHGLRWRGQRDLAAARGDVPGRCAANRRMAERHPHSPEVLLARLNDLHETGTRRERLAAVLAARGPDPQPILDLCEAAERAGDRTGDQRALGLLQRYLRRSPDDPQGWLHLSRIAARAGDWSRARELSRTASLLAPHRRDLAEAHAESCRWSGDPEAGLRWLQRRSGDLGRRMAEPHMTLAWYLDRLDRHHEAEASLVAAAARIEDPVQASAVRLSLCRRIARQDPARARSLLAESGRDGDPGERRRVEALIAEAEGDPAGAIAAWESVVAEEPLAIDGHRSLASLLETHHGLDRALESVDRASARHPWNSDLAMLRIDLLRRCGDPTRYLNATRGFRERQGGAWAAREWGFAAIAAGALDEAAEALAQAESMDPGELGTLNLAGAVALARGDDGAAESAWLASLARDVEQPWTIERLLSTAGDLERARRRLAAIQRELAAQTTHGDGLWAWAEHGRRWLPPEELDRILDEALTARPDLWECWSLRATQHLDRGAEQQALALLTDAVARFPRTPRLQLDLGRTLWRCGRRDEALAALRTCSELSPDWGYAVRERIARVQETGDLAAAEGIARALVARCPDDPGNHAMLAGVLLVAGRHAEGLARLRTACAMDGGDGWAWERLFSLDPAGALAAARDLLRRRPRDLLAHHRLAQALRLGGEPVRAREVYESARNLPGERLPVLLGWVAVLRQLGESDAAEAVCRETVHGVVPRELRLEWARIRHDRGDTATALTTVDALLLEQPEDHAARQCRCEWRSRAERHAEAIADGEELVRRLPGRGMPLAYLGDAQELAGRTEEARATFRRASDSDGMYSYGHSRWFDLSLAARDTDAAAVALDRLHRCDSGPWTLSRKLRLAVARGRPEDGVADLAHLAVDPQGIDPLLAACPEVPPAVWQRSLEDAWRDPGAHRGVGVLLGRSWMHELRDRAVTDRLRTAPRRDAAWQAAVATVADIAGRMIDRDPVTALLRTDGAAVRTDPVAWGLVGWFLNRRREHAAAAAWLADWRERTAVEGWMVFNRISALCQLGRMAEALSDAADSASLPGAEDPMLRTWRAWGAALAGDRPAAEAAMADRSALVEASAGELVHVHDIARTLVSVRPRTWSMLGKLRRHHPGCGWETLRPYIRHTVQVLAAEDGRWWRRVWGWYLAS